MADVARREFAYIVIGLGGLGSGAAYWLSRRTGSDVLGIEQFDLGHDSGLLNTSARHGHGHGHGMDIKERRRSRRAGAQIESGARSRLQS
jgi:glycine/D-amino acid oxidase-like deaminating enzyme